MGLLPGTELPPWKTTSSPTEACPGPSITAVGGVAGTSCSITSICRLLVSLRPFWSVTVRVTLYGPGRSKRVVKRISGDEAGCGPSTPQA